LAAVLERTVAWGVRWHYWGYSVGC
jgi:hypothetical protein